MTDLDRPPLDGELIDLPPEPPHDHIVVTGPGNVYRWDDEADSWVEVDSQYGMAETWEDITRWNRELTVYAPIKEYRDSPKDQPSVKRDWITRSDGSVYADPPVTDAEREMDDGRWIAEARDRGGDWECVGVRRNQFLAMELICDLDRYERRVRRDNEDKGHP